MRVAHFVQRYPPALGGSEAYFARLSRFLVSAGDQVTVFTTTALDLQGFWSPRGRCVAAGVTQEDSVEVRRYQPRCRFRGRRYLLKSLSLLPPPLWQCLTLPCNPLAFGMWRDAGRLGRSFDVVHATAFPYAWPIACGLRLARQLDVPFLLTPFLHLGDPHNPRDRTRRAYTTPALLSLIRAADVIFVQTTSEYDALSKHGIAADKLVLLGMGVAQDECTGGNRFSARSEWGVLDGEVVVGHLANNSREKGTVDLIQAAQRAWRGGQRFTLVLAGPVMPNFEQFWRTLVPAGRVLRLGVLTEGQKRDFFAGIDVFALPSRSDSFGLVLLEAWAKGVANIGYQAGGVADVIRHEQDGLLVRCGDLIKLGEALVQLTQNAELRKALGRAGRERTRQEFCWQDKLMRVRAIYDSVRRAAGRFAPAECVADRERET